MPFIFWSVFKSKASFKDVKTKRMFWNTSVESGPKAALFANLRGQQIYMYLQSGLNLGHLIVNIVARGRHVFSSRILIRLVMA